MRTSNITRAKTPTQYDNIRSSNKNKTRCKSSTKGKTANEIRTSHRTTITT